MLHTIDCDRIWYKCSVSWNSACESNIRCCSISRICNSSCIRNRISDRNNGFISTFVVVNIALLIVVETVLDIFVCDTAGWLGLTTCENCTELKFEIGFILGMFVTSALIVIKAIPLGFIFPICIPFPVFPICCVPESFTRVPDINVVPSGKISVKIIFCEVTFPGLLNVIV